MKEGYPKAEEFRAGVCRDLEPRYLKLFADQDIELDSKGLFWKWDELVGQIALARVTKLDKFLSLGPETLDSMILIKNPGDKYYLPDGFGEKNGLYLHRGMRSVYAGSFYHDQLVIRRRVAEAHEEEIVGNLELYFSSVNEAEIESFL